jgi:TRAP-type C4-dicarboxylate transport system permease small subunit
MNLNLPNGLDKLVHLFLRAKRILLISSSLILALTFCIVVFMRYIFQADLFAYEEWILIVAFWMYFIGAAMGSYENSHIKADFLLTLLKTARSKWILVNVTLFLELLVCLVLVYWAWLMIFEELSAYPEWERTSALQIPYIVPRLSIFVGLALMAFYTFLHLYSGLRSGPSKGWESQECPNQLN